LVQGYMKALAAALAMAWWRLEQQVQDREPAGWCYRCLIISIAQQA
jgi:hypothetical protein